MLVRDHGNSQSISPSLPRKRLTVAAMSRDDAPAAAAPNGPRGPVGRTGGSGEQSGAARSARPRLVLCSNRRETYHRYGRTAGSRARPGNFVRAWSELRGAARGLLWAQRLGQRVGRATLRLLPHARCGDQALQGLTPTSIDAPAWRSCDHHGRVGADRRPARVHVRSTLDL